MVFCEKTSYPPDWCEKQVKFLAETLNFSLFTLDIHGGITDVGNSEPELDWWRGGTCVTLEKDEMSDVR